MRILIAIIFSCCLLILAIIPWALSGCQPQTLVPDEIRLERTEYAATVTAAQGATVDAMRESTSIVKVIPIQTLSLASPQDPTLTLSNAFSSTLIIRTITVLDETPVPPSVSETTLDSITPTPTDNWVIDTPLGLVDIEEILTQEMLMAQFQQDAEGQDLPDLIVRLYPEGIQITTQVAILPGIQQEIEAKGTFIVEHNSLFVNISSIVLDDQDVTDRYAGQLESRINSSLYSLLPQRYVQSVTLFEGEMLVKSKVKP